MAKICVNCGKKIGVFSDDPFEFDNVVLCYDCAKPILKDLNDLYYLKSKKEFCELRNKIINKSNELYSVDAVSSIYKKIESIYHNVKVGLQDDVQEGTIEPPTIEVKSQPFETDIVSKKEAKVKNIATYTYTVKNVTSIRTLTASVTYGTGLLTAIAMTFCNLFGIKCNMYNKKLRRAEADAMGELIEQAKLVGADGVMNIHCQIDGLTFLVYGTAYKENEVIE